MTTSSVKLPRFINRGYGKEKICIVCMEYYPLSKEYFYVQPPSKQKNLIKVYESLCIPCYNYRKAKYRLNSIARKQQLKEESCLPL